MTNRYIHAVALTLLLVGALLSARPALAQDPPFTFETTSFGGGVDPSLHLQAKGDFVVMTGIFTLNPGQQIDWHTNPGVAVFVGLSGSATETDANGCEHHYGPGAVLLESERDIHKIVNDSQEEPFVATGTFIVPVANLAGGLVQPVEPPQPSFTPCGPAHGNGRQ